MTDIRSFDQGSSPAAGGGTSGTRRYELDWLRVLAILAVFAFHSAHFFDPGDWHVKNSTTYAGLEALSALVLVWMMPLIFVVSGASTYYALGKHSGGVFFRDRTLRLMVPLVFGVFTHAIWQVYLERITHHQFVGSFFQFLPRYFDGLYGFGGNFAWMGLHLWYLLMLWVFSIVLQPLFLWLRQGWGQRLLVRLGDLLAHPGGVFLLALPIALLLAVPNPARFLGSRSFGGWSILGFIPVFVNGFLVVSHARLYDSVRRLRWLSLALAVAVTGGLLVVYLQRGEPVYRTPYYGVLFGLYGVASWCWILTMLGQAAQHLRFPKPWLAYANEAVLPFYVLHQTVLLTVGYVVVRWQIPDLLKWAVIVTGSLSVCLVLYEFLIRRNTMLRFLFGMKPMPKTSVTAPTRPWPLARDRRPGI